MSIFSSLIGAVAGPIVGGLIGSVGNDRAQSQERAGAQQALSASRPPSVFGPTGNAVYNAGNDSYTLSPSPQYLGASNRLFNLGNYGLEQYAGFRPQGFNVQAETARLRRLRAPDIAQARSSLQSQLLSRGRLGLGVGGGRRSGLFNPEVAGLEEAILGQQSRDIDQAQNTAFKREALDYDRQAQLLEQAQGLFKTAGALSQGGAGAAQLGIHARTPAGIAALQAQPGMNQASSTRGFFSALGTNMGGAVSDIDLGGIFNPPRPDYPVYGGGPGDYQGQ